MFFGSDFWKTMQNPVLFLCLIPVVSIVHQYPDFFDGGVYVEDDETSASPSLKKLHFYPTENQLPKNKFAFFSFYDGSFRTFLRLI